MSFHYHYCAVSWLTAGIKGKRGVRLRLPKKKRGFFAKDSHNNLSPANHLLQSRRWVKRGENKARYLALSGLPVPLRKKKRKKKEKRRHHRRTSILLPRRGGEGRRNVVFLEGKRCWSTAPTSPVRRYQLMDEKREKRRKKGGEI